MEKRKPAARVSWAEFRKIEGHGLAASVLHPNIPYLWTLYFSAGYADDYVLLYWSPV